MINVCIFHRHGYYAHCSRRDVRTCSDVEVEMTVLIRTQLLGNIGFEFLYDGFEIIYEDSQSLDVANPNLFETLAYSFSFSA